VSWTGWLWAVGSLWVQQRLGLFQAEAWLWLPTGIAGAVAGLAALILGILKVGARPCRLTMFGWALTGLLPLLLWAAAVALMLNNCGPRIVHKLGHLAATNLIVFQVHLSYPNRLETERLIVYYDDRVADPSGDAAAMEAHLLELEKLLGQEQREKIYWIRGGPSSANMCWCINCVALGSEASPLTHIDRHELSHAFLFQFTSPDADPPTLLMEGWARAVEGHPEPLAATALKFRQKDLPLEAFLAPEAYHTVFPWSYSYGGALVDYLLRHYGPERFLDLYNSCRPESFMADFERVYGLSFQEMGTAFWKEMEAASPSEHGAVP
jgi:hypothetical protein